MPTYNARTAGIYRNFAYLGCQERTLTDADTGEDQPRLLWRFQDPDDSTTVGELSKWTGTSLASANSNAHKMAAGIMGRKLQPGDDTETMVGQRYDVVYGPNQAGNLTITSVVRVAAPVASVPAVSVAPAAPQAIVNGAEQDIPQTALPNMAPPELP